MSTLAGADQPLPASRAGSSCRHLGIPGAPVFAGLVLHDDMFGAKWDEPFPITAAKSRLRGRCTTARPARRAARETGLPRSTPWQLRSPPRKSVEGDLVDQLADPDRLPRRAKLLVGSRTHHAELLFSLYPVWRTILRPCRPAKRQGRSRRRRVDSDPES
jgi:hypothetical protein